MRIALAGAICASLGVLSLAAIPNQAQAGGFAVREQSSLFLGSAFAGSAAGGDLSSSYWNPAAIATVPGTNSASHGALIIPDTEITGLPGSFGFGAFPASSGDIGDPALVPSSYFNIQQVNYDSNLFFGVSTNSPFGLVTKPDNTNYLGAELARRSDIFNVIVNPMAAYQLTPELAIGAGVQLSYIDATLKFATGTPGGPSTSFTGEDISFGGTAGLVWTPGPGTSIGVGYRSKVPHTFDGLFSSFAFVPVGPAVAVIPFALPAKADLDLPEIVTVSFNQAVAPNMRLLGTFEWTNWSRLKELSVISTQTGAEIATIPVGWDDGYFVSLGGEFDYSKNITLRVGAAYEWSPVNTPTQRIVNLPDTDRVWVSAGATYKWSEAISLDLSYTHIFFEDGDIDRTSLANHRFLGEVENATDIIGVSFKMKWDGPQG